jgi:hypothetical protein
MQYRRIRICNNLYGLNPIPFRPHDAAFIIHEDVQCFFFIQFFVAQNSVQNPDKAAMDFAKGSQQPWSDGAGEHLRYTLSCKHQYTYRIIGKRNPI